MKENKNCTFCNKHHSDVSTIVVSDNANICNECIEVCSIIIEMQQESREIKSRLRN